MFQKNNILYKVEGSKKRGMGHVFRSYYLIQSLKKKYNIIIFTEKKSESETFFKEKKFKVITYNNLNEYKIFKKTLKNSKINKFVNDYILINQKIYNFLIKLKFNCYFLDTKKIKASKKIHCINTFIDTGQKHKNYYAGLKYIIVDPNLKSKKKVKLNKKLKILLHFGGTDEKKLNIKVANFIASSTKIYSLDIILGPALVYNIEKVYEVIKKIKYRCKIYNYPKNLNRIYNNASIAIISGGNTLFNFCALGKTNISISVTKLEMGSCKKMKKSNLTNYYGHYNDITKKKFIEFLHRVHNKRNDKIKFLKINGIKEIAKIVNS